MAQETIPGRHHSGRGVNPRRGVMGLVELLRRTALTKREAVGASLAVEDSLRGYMGVVVRIAEAEARGGVIRLVVEARMLSAEEARIIPRDAYAVLVMKMAE